MEVLLLLYRESGRGWSAEEVAQALYIQPEAAAGYLDDLYRGGCCACDEATGKYHYSSADSQLNQAVQELAAAYKTRSVAVITRIFSKPQTHLRLFSDAFKIRKDD